MCRPVWEEFVRLDAFEVQIDTSVDIRVVTDDGAVVGSKTTVGRALIENVLDYADGRLHTVQLPIMNTRSGELVGVLHVRLRVAALNDDIIAANKDRNPNVSLLTAPKTYTKQFALSAADVLSSGASGVAGAMRAGLGGALSAVPIPKKYAARGGEDRARGGAESGERTREAGPVGVSVRVQGMQEDVPPERNGTRRSRRRR